MIFKCRKSVGSRGFAPDPTGGAHSAPPDPLAGSATPPLPKKPEPQNPPMPSRQVNISNGEKIHVWSLGARQCRTGRGGAVRKVSVGTNWREQILKGVRTYLRFEYA